MDSKTRQHSHGIKNKVAIVGSACRFPGGSDTPETFFDNLLSGKTYVSDVPGDRWSSSKFYNALDAAGKTYVNRGHFLKDYDFKAFDAEFFNLSPREVEFLDPQQRLLLELTWEALEASGFDVEKMSGSNTGVFVGGFTVDHLLNQFGVGARDLIGTHSAAGATLTMLSNRISYAFNFNGPSISMDTACSSSLVAFVQAVNAIETGHCEVALAGGVNFILRPEYAIAMSKGRFLARDGRSKSFDSRADGYGRGEGGGIVVLKDLAAAQRDGDRILAIVDGAGINQDGRTSGITVPNPDAQKKLMEQVLEQSGCSPDSIDYIEAHGTGTAVGDPLETRAIADVYGSDEGCLVGSVKASIGHLEAAAGIASVIKSVMMLQENMVPPIAGLKRRNSAIPQGVRLPHDPVKLVEDESSARIAINSFGYGGTNAHVILSTHGIDQQSAKATDKAPQQSHYPLLPISARDTQALKERAKQLRDVLLRADEQEAQNVIFTACERRTHLQQRAAIWADSPQDLLAQLSNYIDEKESSKSAEGQTPANNNSKVAFVYTGMGPQWYAMGKELFAENPIFRETLQKADAIFTQQAGFSILEQMFLDEDVSQIKETEYAQPANLLIQIGLTEALRAEGIKASAVVGHSVGEVASGWASGMLSLEDALMVSRERSRIQSKTSGQGGMLALGATAEQALDYIGDNADRVSIAAINSPGSVTLAGDVDLLTEILEQATQKDVFARMLEVSVPYHSPLMEPLKDEIRECLANLQPATTQLPLYSTVTGKLTGDTVDSRFFDAEYWCDNVREAVRFADAIDTMLEDGYSIFVEIGPHPVLRRSIGEVVTARKTEAKMISSLWMNQPETHNLRRCVAELFVNGGTINWSERGVTGQQITLPSYPWQRDQLWRESHQQENDRLVESPAPLNGGANAIDLNLGHLNYLLDHVVDGASIMPAAGFLEVLCEEAKRLWPTCGCRLDQVNIHEAMLLKQDHAQKMQVSFDERSNAASLLAYDDLSVDAPVTHVNAIMHPLINTNPTTASGSLAAEISHTLAENDSIESDELYDLLQEISLQYGPAFQPIVTLTRNMADGVAISQLELPEEAGADCSGYVMHPSLLDGCFQTALSLINMQEGAYLPVSIDSLEVFHSLTKQMYCRVTLVEHHQSHIVCDFQMMDMDGALLAQIHRLTCVAMGGKQNAHAYPQGDYKQAWIPVPAPTTDITLPQAVAIIGNSHDALADALMEFSNSVEIPSQRYEASEFIQLLGNPDGLNDLLTLSTLIFVSNSGNKQGLSAIDLDEGLQLLDLVQQLSKSAAQPQLYLVTRNAYAITDEAETAVDPGQTAIAGLARNIRNELPDLKPQTIDIHPTSIDDLFKQAESIFQEVCHQATPDEIALRGGRRYTMELQQSGDLQAARVVQISGETSASIQLQRNDAGIYQASVINPLTPSATEYCIKVDRVGFVFNDQSPLTGITGTVIACGDQTRAFLPGEKICGVIPKTYASECLVDEAQCALVAIPDNRGETSALMATTEAFAEMLFNNCEPQAGEFALISDGLLGDALARRLAAEGMQIVRLNESLSMESRDSSLSATSVNHVAFQLIAAPLSTYGKTIGFHRLKENGHLIELGQSSAPFAIPTNCSRYTKSDINPLQDGQRQRYQSALTNALIDTNTAEHYDAANLTVADLVNPEIQKTLASYGDTIDLKIGEFETPFDAYATDIPTFDPQGTYLITGGFGGLGQSLALWLARNGVRHLALVGRRGMDSPGAQTLVEQLNAAGARVNGYAIDLSDESAVADLIGELAQHDGQPLRGIFHAAGVLADNLILDLSADDFRKVVQAKATGAYSLHNATIAQNVELEHFVLFSSIANLVGNSRQANYCFANGYLDGLAHYRRACQLPAMSINFGAIAGVGMLEDDVRVGQHLTQIGLTPLDIDIALRGVGRAMSQQQIQIAVSETVAWDKWAAYEVVGGKSSVFKALVSASTEASAGEASLAQQLQSELNMLDESEARQLLTGIVTDIVAAALKTKAERLKPESTFDSFGIDSLMSTEIKIQLERMIGITYSVVELLGHASIGQLVDKAFTTLRSDKA